MTIKKPTTGVEDFAKLIHDGFYYVDKTYVVKELLEKRSDVNLFTRPRRFGKTLLMDMFKCFFEIDGPKDVFEGLKISQEKEICEQYQGKYPVIFLSLKSVEGLTFEVARSELAKALSKEALRHPFLAASDKLNESEKGIFQQLCDMQQNAKAADIDLLTGCIYTLSELLYKHYDQKVIILLDEYDVPLDKAEKNGFYNEMVSLIRGMFNQALKTNSYMKFAVMTGCLRIAKESIFTGLNKVKVYTVLDRNFSDAFGYIDEEVRAMLEYLDLSKHYEDIKAWYDGYQFGDKHIYCPWDVNNYCEDLYTKAVTTPKSYWMNTSGNEIIEKLANKADTSYLKGEIEELLAGGTVRKAIDQELTYRDLYTSMNNIWSVLFMTGYLTVNGDPEAEELELTIPNRGIREVFRKRISALVEKSIDENKTEVRTFCKLFEQGKVAEIEAGFNKFLREHISVRDGGKEAFYHAYLLGMLVCKENWNIQSNDESGEGFGDILIEVEEDRLGIIVELKYDKQDRLEEFCNMALDQIEKKNYQIQGVTRTLKYGIACCKKHCKVMMRE